MHGEDHVSRPAFKSGVSSARVKMRQRVGPVPALLRTHPLRPIARHRAGGVVELQITAAGIVESADRRSIGVPDIFKETVEVGINLLADRGAALAKMQSARRRYGH